MFVPLLCLFIHATGVLSSTTWRPITPPDWIGYSYPTTDVVVNEMFNLGIYGGAFDPRRDYYGLAYEISISTASPDEQITVQSVSDNLHDGGCSQNGMEDLFVYISRAVQLDVAGTYTAIWNVTYGTTDDENVMNITACDTSKLSYQTWLFNVTFNVVDPPVESRPPPIHTDKATTFSTKPTGTMFERSAVETAVPWAPLPDIHAVPLKLPGA